METNKNESSIKYTQNFLISDLLVKKLINKTNINQHDLVLDIGSGKGILTKALSKRAGTVLSIEKDKDLFLGLCNEYKQYENVKVLNEDFLNYKLPKKKFKVFSNIPFNITAQIFSKITNSPFFEEGCFIVQKEYAKKICGNPYSSKNQKESLIMKYSFDINVLYEFKKSDFSPKPSVNIVFLHLLKKEEEDKKLRNDYLDFISFVFLQGKKSIKDSLKHIFTSEQLKRLSSKNLFNLNSKPTEISFEKWLNIFSYYTIGVENKKKIRIKGSFDKLKQTSTKIKKVHRTSYKREI